VADTTITWPSDPALRVAGGFTSTPFLYICDSGNNRIVVVDYEGNPLFSFGSYGTGNGQFSSPYGVTNDGTTVYVTDTGNHRVQYFDLYGNYLGQWGTYGSGLGEFQSPKGIATNGRFVFVVDQGNNRFQIFNTTGSFFMAVGTFGSGENQFNAPTNCYADEYYLWIDDTGNNRIVIYELSFIGDYVVASFPSLTSTIISYIQSAELIAQFPSMEAEISTSLSIISSIDADFPALGGDINSLLAISATIDAEFPSLDFDIITMLVISAEIDADFPSLQSNVLTLEEMTAIIDSAFPDLSSEIMASISSDFITFHTVVMNTLLKAVTEYTRWDFNSFAQYGDKQIGFSDDGIFELTGDEDGSGVKISASFVTAKFDLQEGGSKKKLYDANIMGSLPGNYILTFRGDRNTLVQMSISGFTTNEINTRRQKFSKNLKDRLFKLGFENVLGADFDLDELIVNDEPVYREMNRG